MILFSRLAGTNSSNMYSDNSVATVFCALYDVTSKTIENSKTLSDSRVLKKLMNTTKHRVCTLSESDGDSSPGPDTSEQHQDLQGTYRSASEIRTIIPVLMVQ